MKKVINVDSMTIIERFDTKETEQVLVKYQNDPRYMDVEVDRDGDICVWDND